MYSKVYRSYWKVTSKKVIILYVGWRILICILSSAGHVKSCVNPPEPSGKAKYVKRPIVN